MTAALANIANALQALPVPGGPAAADSADGGFSAMLDNIESVTAAADKQISAAQSADLDLSLAGVFEVAAGAASGEGEEVDDTADAADPAESLLGLVDSLLALNTAVSAATPIPPAVMEQAGTLADTLSGALGASGSEGVAADPTLAALGAKVGEIAEALKQGQPDLAGKLESSAAKLQSGGIDPDLLAELTPTASNPDNKLIKSVQALLDAPTPAAPAPAAVLAAAPAQASSFEPAKLANPEFSVVPEKTADDAAEPDAKKGEKAEHKHDDADGTAESTKKDAAPDKGKASDRPSLVLTGEKPVAAHPHAPVSRHGTVEQNSGAAGQLATAAVNGIAMRGELTAARAAAALYGGNQTQLNVPQLAFDLVRQVQAGNSHFNIKLDPADLGAVEVKLNIDATGAAQARLIVEKPETLDLLQRDQRSLERALQQAGFEGSRTSLEFSLRQGGGGQARHGQSFLPHFADKAAMTGVEAAPDAAVVRQAYRSTATLGGLNIFA